MDTASRSPFVKQPTFAAFVDEQLDTRLRRVAFALNHTRQTMNEEHVHDLRVALRRFMESVRVAKHVLPHDGVEVVLGDLRKIMKDAGHVRGCDIAADLLRGAGAAAEAPAFAHLAERRSIAERKLFEHAQHAYHRNLTAKWRAALLLGSDRKHGAGA